MKLFNSNGCWFFVVVLVCCCFIVHSEAGMKAGVARENITPQENIWMSGYASRNKPSEGVEQDLFAKALALEDADGNQVVMLTIDLIGISAEMTDRLLSRLEPATGLNQDTLMICSSHTHSGPVIRNNLETMYELDQEQWETISNYTKDLEEKLVRVIENSLKELKPVTIFRGVGNAGFAVNRRIYTKSGMTFGENFIAPVDHDVPVMKIQEEDGSVPAILFGYACHNTTLSFYRICGDYAGYAQAYVEEAYPGAVGMFFTGCGGDINPTPRRELDHAKQHGKELGTAVLEVLGQDMIEVEGAIQAESSVTDLPLVPPPTRDELSQQLEDPNKYIRLRAYDLLKRLDEEGSISETYPYRMQAWRIGDDFKMLAMAGEVVVDYSLLFKHIYGAEDTWVIGYVNDVPCYIPSLRILQEGGYEAADSMIYYGMHGPWQPEIEEIIVREMNALVEQVMVEND